MSHTQDVFAAVLEQVGRKGYTSAQSVDDSSISSDSIAGTWDDWFQEFCSTRYSFIAGSDSPSVREGKTATDLRDDYKKILCNAYNNGAYADPQSYVRKLSSEDLSAIQQVHHLANPIQPSSLSAEASLNLLLPPDAQVDENLDGLTDVGAATTFRFPDSNTPSEVRKAWEATTQELSDEDRMLYQMQIGSQLLLANMHFDENGEYLGSSEPGDADWVNPQASPDFSYRQQATKWLDYLDHFSSQIAPEQYQRDHAFWSNFRNNLSLFDA
ncbi:MAG: hypothetical protein ACK52S_04365 [Pirellula sp.]